MVTYSSFKRIESWQDPDQTPFIRIENLSKSYDKTLVVDDVSLNIYQGEFFSILGGSGSGKTTLLRMIAGFEVPDKGKIFIDDIDITTIPAYERPINMMFQSYALFPHMSVEQNIAFGLKQDNLPKQLIQSRVEEMLEMLRMTRHAKKRPDRLSGGQRQRVALARALVKRPKVLLLDEPLAALDKKLREQTQFELVNIQEDLGVTFIVVTHDQEEAMTMSTRVAIMDSGWISQIGTPSEVYEYPNSKNIAEFIGSVNIIEGRINRSEKDYVTIINSDFDTEFYVNHQVSIASGSQVWIAIRPEKIEIRKHNPDEAIKLGDYNSAWGKVKEIAYKGNLSVYIVVLENGDRIRVTKPNKTPSTEMPITWDDEVIISWQADAGVVLSK